MAIQFAADTLSGVAGLIKNKKKARRKRRKARKRKQQKRDALKNSLDAGFNTAPQSSASATDQVGSGRTDGATAGMSNNTVMYAIVGFLAYKFLLKK